jgi:hypothetical protein
MRKTSCFCLVLLLPILLHAQEIEEEEEMVFPSQQNVVIVSEGISRMEASDVMVLKTVFNTSAGSTTGNSGNLLLKPGNYTLPYASSSLPQDAYGFYGASNLDDDDLGTAWSEGVSGPGIGQWIAVAAPDSFTAVVVNNGYCKDQRGWENNNRVKKARVRIYAFTKPDPATVRVGKDKVEYVVAFEDEYEDAFWQVWDGITGISPQGYSSYLFILEILDVYRGRKYDDTCISNISLTVMQ